MIRNAMPDSPDKPNPPSPFEDVRKGLGLLFRAARTTLEQLPTGKLEDAVVSGAKEVGRAIENVANAVEQQVLKAQKKDAPGAKPEGDEKDEPAASPDALKDERDDEKNQP